MYSGGTRQTYNKRTKKTPPTALSLLPLLGVRYVASCELINLAKEVPRRTLINKARFARFCRGASWHFLAKLVSTTPRDERLDKETLKKADKLGKDMLEDGLVDVRQLT